MYRQCLNISQMKHLKELGVDDSNASVYWHRILRLNTGEVVTDWFKSFNKSVPCLASMKVETVPTFILDDILDLLPKEMMDKDDDKFVLKMEYGIHRKVWYIGYYYYDVTFNDLLFSGENLIDAAYEMLCWCAENGYVDTKK